MESSFKMPDIRSRGLEANQLHVIEALENHDENEIAIYENKPDFYLFLLVVGQLDSYILEYRLGSKNKAILNDIINVQQLMREVMQTPYVELMRLLLQIENLPKNTIPAFASGKQEMLDLVSANSLSSRPITTEFLLGSKYLNPLIYQFENFDIFDLWSAIESGYPSRVKYVLDNIADTDEIYYDDHESDALEAIRRAFMSSSDEIYEMVRDYAQYLPSKRYGKESAFEGAVRSGKIERVVRFRLSSVIGKEFVDEPVTENACLGGDVNIARLVINNSDQSSYFDELLPYSGSVEVAQYLKNELGLTFEAGDTATVIEEAPMSMIRYFYPKFDSSYYEYAIIKDRSKEDILELVRLGIFSLDYIIQKTRKGIIKPYTLAYIMDNL